MAKVFPVLHNPAAFDNSRFAARYLVDPPENVPIISYLHMDDEGNSRYVTWESVRRSKRPGLKALNDKAMTDLTHRGDRPGWNRVILPWRGTNVTVLERVGDFLTASDILDSEILEIAHTCLGSREIYVAIPHACYMIAATRPDHLIHQFYRAYSEALEEKSQFFDIAFRVHDEALFEIVTLPQTLIGPEFRLAEEHDKVLWFTAPYLGDFNVLKYYLLDELPQLIPDQLKCPGFTGRVVVDIPKYSQRFSLGQCRELNDVQSTLNRMARERAWLTADYSCVTVHIVHRQQRQAARGIRTSVLDLLPGI